MTLHIENSGPSFLACKGLRVGDSCDLAAVNGCLLENTSLIAPDEGKSMITLLFSVNVGLDFPTHGVSNMQSGSNFEMCQWQSEGFNKLTAWRRNNEG